LQHLDNVLLKFWELHKNGFKCLPVVLETLDFSFGPVVLQNVLVKNDVLEVENVTTLKESLGCSIDDNTGHYEENAVNLLPNLGDLLASIELDCLQLLQEFAVEVIISALEERVYHYGILE
jgi:hypothetical protein